MSGILRISQRFNLNALKCSLCGFLRKNPRNFSESGTLDVNTNVVKDVILFKYENPRFFKAMNIFAICQFVFWSYLGVFSFRTLRDAPVEKTEENSWWQKINLGENKYKNGLSAMSLILGYGVLLVAWMYILKSVRYVVLLKGGKQIALVTYTPFGKSNRILTTELKNVSCLESRQGAKSLLPIKVKGQRLFYILDMKGEFKNPILFDHTAGLKRKHVR